jgi:hypothetical protein
MGGNTCCGVSCVNTNTDEMYCGNCSTMCDTGETCNSGTCE